ncbi:DNA ligase LigA-related protein [Neobacillus sp. SCS-31]|uniref:DNA ligase LigA-related protein n=1 Tax=Neobacillus oceani TaxID=3115292 RepID=UPI003906B1B2
MDISTVTIKHETPIETLHRYQRSFLIHSFLYYKLDESIISDKDYDKRCSVMNGIMQSYPDLAEISDYYELCKPCAETGSGYYIMNYPPETIERAFQLLFRIKKPNVSYSEFVSKWGYQVIG